jgi:hypothetical protein
VSKPREWTIRLPTLIVNNLNEDQRLAFPDSVHVIEYSAYLDMALLNDRNAQAVRECSAKYKKAVEALKAAAEYSRYDDVNGIAGEIAEDCLRELGEMEDK